MTNKNNWLTADGSGEFLFYTTPAGDVKVEVFFQNETVWMTQAKMAEMFGVQRPAITKHLKNIFESNELDEKVTCSILEHVTQHGAVAGKTRIAPVKYYNLDAILAVGYRVNSRQAITFRRWASEVLKEYLTKGFVMDDNRLKHGQSYFGKDHFKELLERVRSIRASERRIYMQITDIFQECATDYKSQSPDAQRFFATVQNKFHYAITGMTAAEKIYSAADHTKPKMGLTTYKNAPDGRVIKSDVTTAKNYLSEKDIKKLERTVTSFFDYIENQIEKHEDFTMASFAESVGKFLAFNDFKVLDGTGKISRAKARLKAHGEYDVYNKTQKIDSDFEKHLRSTQS